ncbi:MAG TPA: hypothetical protein VFH22_08500 [Rhodocyclaceae bacterium]|nr:hypothetical protein [Rhodocyclaceae bacterium]
MASSRRHEFQDWVKAAQFATKVDLAEAKAEIIKWTIDSMFAAVGMFAVIIRIMTP